MFAVQVLSSVFCRLTLHVEIYFCKYFRAATLATGPSAPKAIKFTLVNYYIYFPSCQILPAWCRVMNKGLRLHLANFFRRFY